MFRAFLIAALVFATPCMAAPPAPAVSEYLATEGGGFMVKKGEGILYAVTFSIQKPLASPAYATIEFENPVPGEPPLRNDQTIEPGATQLLAQSAPIKRIKVGNTYAVSVTLFSDSERKHVIGTHVQSILFNFPESAMRAFGVEPL